MKAIETSAFPQPATLGTPTALRAPRLDPAVVDYYLRRGREARAEAFSQMVRGLFSSPASRRGAEVHALPVRDREALPGAAERADRAA